MSGYTNHAHLPVVILCSNLLTDYQLGDWIYGYLSQYFLAHYLLAYTVCSRDFAAMFVPFVDIVDYKKVR